MSARTRMVTKPSAPKAATTRKSTKKSLSASEVGLKHGFRSGLEDATAVNLEARGVSFTYENEKLPYVIPETRHTYTPDFHLKSLLPGVKDIIVETKGKFEPADRKKHIFVRAANPNRDIRFLFNRSKSPIRKGSKTTYAMWCEENGFKYADKVVPQEWLEELGYGSRVNGVQRHPTVQGSLPESRVRKFRRLRHILRRSPQVLLLRKVLAGF